MLSAKLKPDRRGDVTSSSSRVCLFVRSGWKKKEKRKLLRCRTNSRGNVVSSNHCHSPRSRHNLVLSNGNGKPRPGVPPKNLSSDGRHRVYSHLCVPMGHVKHVLPRVHIKYDAIKYPPTTLANYVLKKKRRRKIIQHSLHIQHTCTWRITAITLLRFFFFFNGWKDGIFLSFTTGTENFFLIDYFVLGSWFLSCYFFSLLKFSMGVEETFYFFYFLNG